jgi:hypothetical protein
MPNYYPRVPPGCAVRNYSVGSAWRAVDWGATGTGGYYDPWSGYYLRDLVGIDLLAHGFRLPTTPSPDARPTLKPLAASPTLKPLSASPVPTLEPLGASPVPRESNPSYAEARRRAMAIATNRRATQQATPRSPNPRAMIPGHAITGPDPMGWGCPPGSRYAGVGSAGNNAFVGVCRDRNGRVVSTFGPSRTFYPPPQCY